MISLSFTHKKSGPLAVLINEEVLWGICLKNLPFWSTQLGYSWAGEYVFIKAKETPFGSPFYFQRSASLAVLHIFHFKSLYEIALQCAVLQDNSISKKYVSSCISLEQNTIFSTMYWASSDVLLPKTSHPVWVMSSSTRPAATSKFSDISSLIQEQRRTSLQ